MDLWNNFENFMNSSLQFIFQLTLDCFLIILLKCLKKIYWLIYQNELFGDWLIIGEFSKVNLAVLCLIILPDYIFALIFN